MTETIVCITCKKGKPIEQFHRRKDSVSGRRGQCGECRSVAEKERRWQNGVKPRISRWNAGNLGRITEHKRSWGSLYNLTLGQYLDIFDKQDGRCAICKKPPNGKKILSVDHDHTTKCPSGVRGLLCCSCNLCLRRYKVADRKEYIEVWIGSEDLWDCAISYLERYNKCKKLNLTFETIHPCEEEAEEIINKINGREAI